MLRIKKAAGFFGVLAVAGFLGFMVSCNSGSSISSDTGVPVLAYNPATVVDTVGHAATHTPALSGGTPTGCASTPALPAGLTLNATTCVISGTPTVVAAATAYSISAVNASGADTAMLALSVVAGSTPVDTNPANLGENPLGTSNGIAFALGSHVYKLGDANVYKVSPNGKRQLDVSNRINGLLVDTTSYQGAYIYNASLIVNLAAPGMQTCATGDSIVLFATGLGLWTGTYTATACSVQVDYMSASGGMAGKIISASLKNANGKILSISNAQFRVYQHTGISGIAPALDTTSPGSAWSVSLNIDSGTFELPSSRYFLLDTPTVGGGFAFLPKDGTNSLDRLSLHFISVVNQIGIDTCGRSFSGGFTSMELWLGTYSGNGSFEHVFLAERVNGKFYGSCSINVLRQPTNNKSSGTYTATLVIQNPQDTLLLLPTQRRIKIHGEFKN